MWDGVEFGPNEALLCWGWVDQERRGNRIFQVLIAALARHVRTRNVAIRTVADVPVEPLASIVAHHRMGFHLWGELSYTCLLGRLVSRKVEPLSDGDIGRIFSGAEQRLTLSS
jgi:hypothetical protein